MKDSPRSFGWIPDPQAVDEVRSTLPFPAFQETEAFQSQSGSEDVHLWDACRKVTGDILPARDQKSVGCCVGFGTASAIEHLICVQAANASDETFREVSPEIIYAGSRVEIGGGRVRGDGSVGAWAAKFVNQYGVLPRGKFNLLDLTKYDERTCRELGVKGVPDELEPLVPRQVRDVVRVARDEVVQPHHRVPVPQEAVGGHVQHTVGEACPQRTDIHIKMHVWILFAHIF